MGVLQSVRETAVADVFGALERVLEQGCARPRPLAGRRIRQVAQRYAAWAAGLARGLEARVDGRLARRTSDDVCIRTLAGEVGPREAVAALALRAVRL